MVSEEQGGGIAVVSEEQGGGVAVVSEEVESWW